MPHSKKSKITSCPVDFNEIKYAVHGKSKKSKKSRSENNYHAVPRSFSSNKCPSNLSTVCSDFYKGRGYPDNYWCRDDTGDKDCNIPFNGTVTPLVSGGVYSLYLPVDKQYVLWGNADNVFYLGDIGFYDISFADDALTTTVKLAYDLLSAFLGLLVPPPILRLSGKGEDKTWPYII